MRKSTPQTRFRYAAIELARSLGSYYSGGGIKADYASLKMAHCPFRNIRLMTGFVISAMISPSVDIDTSLFIDNGTTAKLIHIIYEGIAGIAGCTFINIITAEDGSTNAYNNVSYDNTAHSFLFALWDEHVHCIFHFVNNIIWAINPTPSPWCLFDISGNYPDTANYDDVRDTILPGIGNITLTRCLPIRPMAIFG